MKMKGAVDEAQLSKSASPMQAAEGPPNPQIRISVGLKELRPVLLGIWQAPLSN